MAETDKKSDQGNLAATYYGLAFGDSGSWASNGPIGWLQNLALQEDRDSYRAAAAWWLVFVIMVCALAPLTVIALTIIGSIIAVNISPYEVGLISSMLIGLDAFLFIIAIVLIAFGLRSYRINKHLEVVYTHRWALQNSLLEHLQLAGNDDKARQKQLTLITSFLFKDIETGHITKKDGLGDPMAVATKLARKR